YLPEAEHGLDKTLRKVRTELRTYAPWPAVSRNFASEGLFRPQDLPDMWAPLFKLSQELFVKYVREPRGWLVRGQFEPVSDRLEVLTAAWELELDADVRPRAAKWRQRVEDAFRGLRKGGAAATQRWNAVWGDDPFFHGLREAKKGLTVAEGRDSSVKP